MIETLKLDLLEALSKSEAFISFSDATKLKEASDHTIRAAARHQDPDALQLAIAIYALSKLVERGADLSQFAALLAEARGFLSRNHLDEYHATIAKLLDRIAHADSKMGRYVEEVLNQAKVRKGGDLFATGLSVQQAAHVIGVSTWELMHYIGKTHLTEAMPSLDANTRLRFARTLFK